MKRLHTGLTICGLLAVLFCFTATSSSGNSEESKLEQKTDAFLKSGDHESAFKLIEDFIQKHPEKPIGHAMLVRVLATGGQIDKALKAYYQFYKLSGTLSEELLLELMRGALNYDDDKVRWSTAKVLGELEDTRAISALANAFNDDDSRVRVTAVKALGKLGDKRAVPALINALSHDDINVRRSAAEALGKLGDKRAVPTLISTLNDEES